jgi:hypothetical protein
MSHSRALKMNPKALIFLVERDVKINAKLSSASDLMKYWPPPISWRLKICADFAFRYKDRLHRLHERFMRDALAITMKFKGGDQNVMMHPPPPQ